MVMFICIVAFDDSPWLPPHIATSILPKASFGFLYPLQLSSCPVSGQNTWRGRTNIFLILYTFVQLLGCSFCFLCIQWIRFFQPIFIIQLLYYLAMYSLGMTADAARSSAKACTLISDGFRYTSTPANKHILPLRTIVIVTIQSVF